MLGRRWKGRIGRDITCSVGSAHGNLGCGALTNTAAGQDTEQKRNDQDDRDGHEQKDQLFTVQLYFAKSFVAHGFFSTPVICFNKCIISIGRGKTIVERSRAVLVSVCSYRSTLAPLS